jgi:histidyl-tRNA synthetase
MNRHFETIKGTFEYLPDKQIVRENIKSVLQSTFIKYGFAPVETPILSSYELLASKYSEGADILNEMYTLSDRGERALGLRYDLTVAFCKLISSNPKIILPFKRYEIGKVFRDGPVRVGRNREFTQCDVDMVGVKSMMAEAEYMTMAAEAYKNLGLDIVIKFNNRKLLSGLITAVCGKITEDTNRKIIMLIDKFAKLTDEELKKQFDELGISETKYLELKELLSSDFKMLECKLDKYTLNSVAIEGLAEIKELYSFMDGTTAVEYMQFAPYLARGIDIYTGTVWEVFLKDGLIGSENNQVDFRNTSIGGGGRYDKIITGFVDDGKEYPAVGMTFGLDVIYEVLTRIDNSNARSFVDLFVIPMETEKESFAFVSSLRALGINVEIEKNKRKVKKSMDYANKTAIPFTCVIGSNEIEQQLINIKNMNTGEQQQFSLTDYMSIAKHVH